MILGAVGALVLIVGLIAMSGSEDEQEPAADRQTEQRQPAAPTRSTPSTPLQQGAARAGKTPDRPAPTLTTEMLQRANALVDEAKALNNDGTRLRNTGDNRGARAKQSEAKRKIDAALAVIEAPSAWQEEADLEGWAMPAEYVTLERLFGRIAKLQKRIRMGGGN